MVINIDLLLFKYKGEKPLPKTVQVGASAFGDLEVLMEPHKGEHCLVVVKSNVYNFFGAWESILNKFFNSMNIVAYVEINDFGAPPAIITMRLLQAVELSCCKDD
ncbi:MAG: malonate decarboxylase acyl carrier protein [Bacillota bacterium]|nr:malonate decarboxylase acyl carrier protein [Bacillota bacterium]